MAGEVSFVRYQIAGRYTTFAADVGLNDSISGDAESPVTFRVLGDGRELWKSSPMRKKGESSPVSLDVCGVKELRLETSCSGQKNGNCHATWFLPRLTPAATNLAQIERLTSPDFVWSEPETLGPVVNAARKTSVPTLTDDQLRIVVGRYGKQGDATNGLHELRRATLDAPWEAVAQLKERSGGYASLSADGLTLVYGFTTASNDNNIAVRTRSTRDAPWSDPKPIGSLNTENLEYRPVNSPDGLSLVICSDRPGGIGKGDLWISRRTDTQADWQPPVHLGDRINTDDFEAASQILADNRSILFHRDKEGLLLLATPDAQGAYAVRPVPLPPNLKIKKCWLSPDGATLYFDYKRDSDDADNSVNLIRRVPKGSAGPTPIPVRPIADLATVVYLDDLTEIEARVGIHSLGKHGKFADQQNPDGHIKWRGAAVEHSLWMHPTPGNISFVRYRLAGQYAAFAADAGLNESPSRDPSSPGSFRVLGDGRELWKSTPLQKRGESLPVALDVRGVQELRLETSCGDNNGACHTTWFYPRLTPVAAPQSSAAGAAPVPAIPAEALTFGGHRYLLVDSPGTWDEAKAKAEAMGGHLATLTTQEERDWTLKNVFEKRAVAYRSDGVDARIFLGAERPAGDKPWSWVTGEPFDLSLWLGAGPDGSGNRHVLTWFMNHSWDDVSEEKRYRYLLVEWDTLGAAVGLANGPQPPLAVAPFDAAQAKAHQQAWAKHLGTQVETTNSVGQKMVLIPPGEFLMGSTDEQVEAALKVAEEIKADDASKNRIERAERPQHKVVITKPFLMSATEVTVGQFKKFSASGYVTEAEKGAQDDPKARTYLSVESDDLPAAFITWNDAVAYCKWLSEQEKRTYRLPTEAEWEYACRAGTTTQYSFGDDYKELPKYGWHNKNTGQKSHLVGSLLPNPFGLFDMSGNLDEWCGDYFDENWYSTSPPNDPTGPPVGSLRVIRGGIYYYNASISRSASRNSTTQSNRLSHHGFRCVSEWSVPATTMQPATASKLFMHDPAFPQWRKEVQAMPAEQQVEAVRKKLMELNPGFDGVVFEYKTDKPPKIEKGVVTEFGFHSDSVTDLSPVRVFGRLNVLRCDAMVGRSKLSDLSPLEGMQVGLLYCSHTSVRDLSPLKGMRLTSFFAHGSQVSDVSVLAGMPLTKVTLGDAPISDIAPLERCRDLRTLALKGTRITPAQVAALQKALPNCKIEWDDPAKATTQPAASGTK